jgi:hypothetical protein
LTILFQNIRSIKNKLCILEALTDDIDLPVICLSETWITTPKIDLLKVEGYTLASSFCRTNNEGGGVCILLKQEIDSTECKDIVNMSIENLFEVSAVEISSINLVLINLYWPNSTRQPDQFFNLLNNLMNYIQIKYNKKDIVIGGDFNVNVSKQSKTSTTLLNLMKSYNFHQNVKEPTRISDTSATCIDLIFKNFQRNHFKTEVGDYGFSDHKGILVNIPSIKLDTRSVWTVQKRLFHEKNCLLFKSELNKINFENIFSAAKNVNENYKIFYDTLFDKLNICVPKTNIKINSIIKKNWLTKGIKLSCKHKRLLKIFISQNKNRTLKTHYKQYEKILKRTVTASKRLQNVKKIKNADNIVKSMWQIVKRETNKNNKNNRNNIVLNIENKETEDPKTIANTFNKYFSTVGKPITPTSGHPAPPLIENSLYLRPVSEVEVKNLIKHLKNKHSFGYDEMPPHLIRQCADELASPLAYLINQSFSEGTFPDALKISVIKPIHKKGNKNDCNNYRPIALLSTFSKLFETAMSKRLYSFCEKYNILSDYQYGFREKRSTTLAVYTFVREVLSIINDKKHAVGILLDMSKAYDRVPYNILLSKLKSIGVRGNAHAWFSSYLLNRLQCVEIECSNYTTGEIHHVRSEILNIEQSIPQGSVLGCILFLIYINDLPKIINTPCTLFADDISFVISCQNEHNLNYQLNYILTAIVTWLKEHNLEVNFDKTKLIQFKPHQKRPININFTFQNTVLESVSSTKFLGVIIDSSLKWKDHISEISNKLNRFTYALYNLKKCTDLKSSLSAYYAYAHAWLQYGIVLWGNSTNIINLFRLQKRCIRILVNVNSMVSCKSYFVKLKILTLVSIYILEICIFVKNNLSLFPQYTRSQNLRPKTKLARPNSTLTMVHTSPYGMSIKIYNKIPDTIKNINDQKKFKNTIKSYLMRNAFYTLEEFFNDKTLDWTAK